MIKPIGTNILAKIKPKKFKTSDSGIILGTTKSVVEDRETSGEVIDIGPEVKFVKIGDIAHFEVVSGIDLEFDNEKYLILRESSILGIQRI